MWIYFVLFLNYFILGICVEAYHCYFVPLSPCYQGTLIFIVCLIGLRGSEAIVICGYVFVAECALGRGA